MSAEPPLGYRTQSEDTSYAVEQRLFERWRSMGPVEKAALVSSASRGLHELCLAGVRLRHPTACERELELRALVLEYGEDLVRRLLGAVPDARARTT